jgi:hypothetical protein
MAVPQIHCTTALKRPLRVPRWRSYWGKPYMATALPPHWQPAFFNDLPVNHWAADWIEHSNADGIRAGWGADALMCCPDSPVTRDQVAVFVVRTFGL